MKRLSALLPLLLALWSGSAPAAPLGRLFFTPAERAAGALAVSPPPTTSPTVAAPRLDGVLRTGSGRTLVWLDGEPRTLEAGAQLRFDPAHGEATFSPAAAPLRLGDTDASEPAPRWRRAITGTREPLP